MRGVIYAIVAALGLASTALANHEPGHNTVRIGLHEYSTGLLRKPKVDGNARYFSFGEEYIAALPDSYDARTESECVPPIRDQGQCGSCWSFARTGALETADCLAGNPLQNLAEQDTLVNDHTAYGCDGGFMDGAYEVNHGVTTEAACPYRASDNVACSGAVAAKATRWAMIGGAGTPSVDDLRAAIYAYKAIAVTVAAGGGFNPVAGRITTCSSSSINHMVQLVGYRPTPGGTGYEFLIKNSWGTGWGQAGFAWSKQGCNKLAVDAGDAALFFYVEGGDPTPVPVPTALDLPLETRAAKGDKIALQTEAKAGYKYKWSTGITGARIWVQTTTSVDLTLTATNVATGAVTKQTTKVTVVEQ